MTTTVLVFGAGALVGIAFTLALVAFLASSRHWPSPDDWPRR